MNGVFRSAAVGDDMAAGLVSRLSTAAFFAVVCLRHHVRGEVGARQNPFWYPDYFDGCRQNS